METQAVSQYEKAARRYCEMTGQQPDAAVPICGDTQNGMMTLAYRATPAWVIIASEMSKMSLMLKCMGEA